MRTRAAEAGKSASNSSGLNPGELSLSCQDRGVGIPVEFDWRNGPSLGLRIVRILTKQIDGNLTLDRNGGGTRFELTFPAAARSGQLN